MNMATSLLDDPSIASYREYPTKRPFLNSDLSYSSDRKVAAYPESSSQAVLSALKGLQDKINNLELERSRAEKNLQSLVAETSLYKDLLKDSKKMSPQPAVRTSFSQPHQEVPVVVRLPPKSVAGRTGDGTGMSKKTVDGKNVEVESQLRNADTRCKLLERQLENMRRMVQSAERERSDALERQVVLERDRGRVTAENLEAQARLSRLEYIQNQFEDLATRKEKSESKVKDLEEKLQKEIHQRKVLSDKAALFQSEVEANRIIMKHEMKKPKMKKKSTKPKPRQVPTKAVRSKTMASNRHYHGSSSSQPHYRLNLADIPFITGTSSSPSHAVSANVQSLIHQLKHHNPMYCNDRIVCEKIPSSESSSDLSDDSSERKGKMGHQEIAATAEDLSDLLIALQDEFGKMTFEHQVLAKQIANTSDTEVCKDLEFELEALVTKMDKKGEQIATVKRHRSQLQKRMKTKSRVKSAKMQSYTRSSSEPRGVRKGRETIYSASASSSPHQHPAELRKKRIEFLREMRSVRSALQQDDLSWE